jgi:uncharacterized membrane protein
MKYKNLRLKKSVQTALLTALCFVSFTFLQIKIPIPEGDTTSLHIGNAFCVLAALLLGRWYEFILYIKKGLLHKFKCVTVL